MDVNRRILLDGATATNLYRMGMPHGVCVEEWILDHPDAIQSLQQDFVSSGSDVIYAPTFSANRVRLSKWGLGDRTREYCTRIVALTRAVAGNAKVAGDLSPTGLMLEPYGETTFNELVDVYTEQAQALNDAGVDLFAIETMLDLAETRAAVLACRPFGKPIYVTMTLGERGRLYMGGSPAAALITLQGMGVTAFGFNCAFGPAQVAEVIREILPFATIPLIAKPNAGEPNPLLPDQYDIGPAMMKEAMREMLDAGASIIGGCCGTTPEHITSLRELLNEWTPPPPQIQPELQENDILLSGGSELYSLDNDRMELSEPITCRYDMADDLLDAADENFDVLLIRVDSAEEAEEFALNAHMAKLPICFHASSAEALERALYLYHGRCMVDRKSFIPEEAVRAIAERYGAVLY